GRSHTSLTLTLEGVQRSEAGVSGSAGQSKYLSSAMAITLSLKGTDSKVSTVPAFQESAVTLPDSTSMRAGRTIPAFLIFRLPRTDAPLPPGRLRTASQ